MVNPDKSGFTTYHSLNPLRLTSVGQFLVPHSRTRRRSCLLHISHKNLCSLLYTRLWLEPPGESAPWQSRQRLSSPRQKPQRTSTRPSTLPSESTRSPYL